MKLPININDLLTARTVEWERLEFKAGWNPKAVPHTMCVFANDFHNLGGEYIIIGVAEDKGRPVLPSAWLPVSQVDAIFDSAIYHTQRQITLRHEFRSRLIADLVTGKMDVCEAARRIPDKAAADDSQVEKVDGFSEGYDALDSSGLTEREELDEIVSNLLKDGTGASQ